MAVLGKCPKCQTPLTKAAGQDGDGREISAYICMPCTRDKKMAKTIDKWGMEELKK